jgi:hypothetical protein
MIVLGRRGWKATADHSWLLDECSAVKWKRLCIFSLAVAAADDINDRT